MNEIFYPSLKVKANLCGRLPGSSNETREQSQESLNVMLRPFAPATIWPTKRMIGPVTGRAKAEHTSALRMTGYAGTSANTSRTGGLRNSSPDDSSSVTLGYPLAMKQSTNGSMPTPGILSRYWFGLTATVSVAVIPGVTRKPIFPRESRFGIGRFRSCNAEKSGTGRLTRPSPGKAWSRFKSALSERHALPSSASYPEKELTQ